MTCTECEMRLRRCETCHAWRCECRAPETYRHYREDGTRYPLLHPTLEELV